MACELLGDIAKGYQMSEMCREMRITFCLLQMNHHSLKKAGCETIIKTEYISMFFMTVNEEVY